MLVAPDLRPSLSQGDIIENVRVVEPHLGIDDRTLSVMVLSHGCEIDKPKNNFMLGACFLPVTDVPGDPNLIRDGKALSFFCLPEFDECVDFRQTFRISFQSIGATAFRRFEGDPKPQRVFAEGISDPRIHSLTDLGIATLWGRLVAFYTRNRNREPDTAPVGP